MSKINKTTLFVRSVVATKGDEKRTVTAQPYITGMYVVFDSEWQLAMPHKKYRKSIENTIAALEQDGFEVEVTRKEYGDFLDEADIHFIN